MDISIVEHGIRCQWSLRPDSKRLGRVFAERNKRGTKSNSIWINKGKLIKFKKFLNYIYIDLQPNWPETLQQFLTRLGHLHTPAAYQEASFPLPSTKISGVNPKKMYEIYRLTVEIQLAIVKSATHSKNNIIIVDMGSGLGYLSQWLHDQHGYRVLGIDADPARVRTARQRQRKLYPKSIGNVFYAEKCINDDTAEFIRSELRRCFPGDDEVVMIFVGLHACADLTVATIRLYLQMTEPQLLAIMPCCYHKMAAVNGETFVNIPLSQSMINACSTASGLLTRPFLRLASQQTAERWRRMTAAEHRRHGQAMFDRAVVQAVLSESKIIYIF